MKNTRNMAHENRIHPYCFPWNPVPGWAQLVEYLPNMHEALGLFPNTTKMGHGEACL